MKKGTELVNMCSKVHRLNCVARACYNGKLEALEASFMKLFVFVMLAQVVRDQKNHNFQQSRRSSVTGEVIRSAYMLTARNLFIAWGDTPSYWTWLSSAPGDRFSEVAELVTVCWLEIRGLIKTSMLSPNTLYGAYFVFKQSSKGTFGFKNRAVEVSVKVVGEGDGQRRMVYLEAATPQKTVPRAFNSVYSGFSDSTHAATLSLLEESSWHGNEYPNERVDGWMEVKLGDLSGDGEDNEVEMGVREVDSNMWKGGILVRGIEIRPK